MSGLIFLLTIGFGPNLIAGCGALAATGNRSQAFRASRALSLAVTVLPVLIAIAAVNENTPESPDEGFGTFLGAFLLLPFVASNWLTTLYFHLVARRKLPNNPPDPGL